MALIKCSGCGHIISDKASKCPKCGCTQAGKQQRPDVPQHESRQVESHLGRYDKGSVSHKWLYFVIAFFLLILIGGLYLLHHEKIDSMTPKENGLKTMSLDSCEVDTFAVESDVDMTSESNNTEETIQEESTASSLYINMHGIFNDLSYDVSFVFNGTSGWYTYTQDGIELPKRTLTLESFDEESGQYVFYAYLNKEYIGKFDGTFEEVDVEGCGDIMRFYSGIFESVKGEKIRFDFNDLNNK